MQAIIFREYKSLLSYHFLHLLVPTLLAELGLTFFYRPIFAISQSFSNSPLLCMVIFIAIFQTTNDDMTDGVLEILAQSDSTILDYLKGKTLPYIIWNLGALAIAIILASIRSLDAFGHIAVDNKNTFAFAAISSTVLLIALTTLCVLLTAATVILNQNLSNFIAPISFLIPIGSIFIYIPCHPIFTSVLLLLVSAIIVLATFLLIRAIYHHRYVNTLQQYSRLKK